MYFQLMSLVFPRKSPLVFSSILALARFGSVVRLGVFLRKHLTQYIYLKLVDSIIAQVCVQCISFKNRWSDFITILDAQTSIVSPKPLIYIQTGLPGSKFGNILRWNNWHAALAAFGMMMRCLMSSLTSKLWECRKLFKFGKHSVLFLRLVRKIGSTRWKRCYGFFDSGQIPC